MVLNDGVTVMMLRSIIMLLCFYSYTAYSDVCLPLKNAQIIGVATHAKTGVFLYCEYHVIEKNTSQVIYTDKTQSPIAIKTVDYSMSLLAPNILQHDYRHSEMVSVTRQESLDKQSVDTLLLEYKGKNSNNILKKIINDRPDLVVDAGFDNAIRYYWDALSTKKKVSLKFVVPAKSRTITLLVKQTKLSRCRLPTVRDVGDDLERNVDDDERYFCYVVKPKSTLLGWFVKPIILLYARDTQRLMYFSGSSNVSTAAGKGQMVNIDYRYL